MQLFRNEAYAKTTLSIKADDGTVDSLVSTPGHKYYLPLNDECREVDEVHEHDGYEKLSVKWVSACNLRVGDKVLLADVDSLTGKPRYGIVTGVDTEECSEAWTTYNFEVEGYHTYHVGKSGVCTHNKCKPTSPQKLSKSEIKKFDAELYKEGYVGNKGSRFDIFKDTANNNKIWLGDKSQKIWIETYEHLSDLFRGGW